MKTKLYILLLMFLSFLGCRGILEGVQIEYSDYEKETTISYRWVYLESNETFQGSLTMNPYCFISPSGETRYSLLLNYSASDWIYLKEGENLEMQLGGDFDNKISFNLTAISSDASAYGGSVTCNESAWVYCERTDIETIASNPDTKVRLVGSRPVYYTFTEENSKEWLEFLTGVDNYLLEGTSP